MNCNYAQGYHIARPLPVDELHQFLLGDQAI
jgi:EAL domain-containing protein (putative c-di-GMP-specific phosphodiesterase class I)